MVGLRRDRRRRAHDELRPPGRAREGDRVRPLHRRPHAHGPAACRVPLRRPPARPHPPHRHRSAHGRCPACSPSSPTRTSPTSCTAASSRTGVCSRGTTVRFEGDIVAGVAALTPEIARAGGGARRGRPTSRCRPDRLRGGARRRRPARASGLGVATRATRHSAGTATCSATRRSSKGDVDAALAAADVVVKGRYVTDPIPGRADRAARDRRGVARRPGDDLVVDAGALCRAQRRRPHAPDAGVERARHRAPPRRGLRRQVRLPLRRRTSRRSRAPPGVP